MIQQLKALKRCGSHSCEFRGKMRVFNYENRRVLVKTTDEILKNYKGSKVDLKKGKWVGSVSKSEKNMKQISSPYSMGKLLKMLNNDEYHSGCIDAISQNVIMKFECSDPNVQAWLKTAQFPKRANVLKLLRLMVKYYIACGNGLLLKARDRSGNWVGLERLIPSELAIVEAYNPTTFYLEPDYIQVRDGKKKHHKNKDVIHFLEETHLSEAWGLASLPIAVNIEILQEIKKFDYNNFKNGLLIDYIFIVNGKVSDEEILDSEGNPALNAAGNPATIYDTFSDTLKSASGNDNSHKSAMLETGDSQVTVEVHRLREEVRDGGYLKLKKDLREGIFAYHRVPPRIVSQLVSGQLGGDNNSDLTLFYENKIKPIQRDVAQLLADEFNLEFQYQVDPNSFDFGDLRDAFLSEEEKQFRGNMRGGR